MAPERAMPRPSRARAHVSARSRSPVRVPAARQPAHPWSGPPSSLQALPYRWILCQSTPFTQRPEAEAEEKTGAPRGPWKVGRLLLVGNKKKFPTPTHLPRGHPPPPPRSGEEHSHTPPP